MSLNCDVYLVHYGPLAERLDFMRSQLSYHKIDYQIISSEPLDGWVSNDMKEATRKLSYFGNNTSRSMNKAEISLAWKHVQFIKRAAESSRPCLVLEDDAILSNNFVEVINCLLEKSDDWDVIFPGSGCNLRKQGHGLIRVMHPASKCTDSYIVSTEAAKKLNSTLSKNIDLAIDWELNYQMMIHDLRVYWLEPPVVRQGSQDGTWYSSINNKKEDLFS